MKHPREVLFERHRSAEPGLDAIRQDALASLPITQARESRRKETPPNTRSSFLELLLPLRWHLAGMSAAWVFIALFNIDSSSAVGQGMVRQDPPPPAQLLAALRENRRQIAELLGSSASVREPAVQLPAFVPKRRSELQSPSAMA